MKYLSFLFCAAAFAAASTLSASAEGIVYQQLPNYNANQWGYYSENVLTVPGEIAAVYDDFSVFNNTTLGSIRWYGDVPLNGSAPLTSFTISINSNLDGLPGFLLYQEQITGLANQATYTVIPGGGYDFNTYSAPINFQAVANTNYWISIVASVTDEQAWAWHISTAGNNNSYEAFSDSPIDQISYDFAFTLYDNVGDVSSPPAAVTPEPGSLMLTGTGLLSLAGAMRRRFAHK